MHKYVIVSYNGQPYPGYVSDIDAEDVFVRCMHNVGKKLNSCYYYWPRCVVDECWYSLDHALSIISEPMMNGTILQITLVQINSCGIKFLNT